MTLAHDAILVEYDALEPALREHGEALHGELVARLASEPGLKLHSTTIRLKSRASLAAKLARPDRTYTALADVTDLVGIRVITYFEDGVDRVGELLEAQLPIELHQSVDKRTLRAEGHFGYRSLHYVCRLAVGGVCAEIQVRTMLEHTWAEIEHDLGYKSAESVPADARRRLSRLAGMLELVDQEFVAIRRDLGEYERTLPARIASADDVALDLLSLESLLAQDDVAAIDRAIADAQGTALDAAPFFPDYLLRMLRACGITTVAAARAGLVRRRDAILGMAAPYFRFAEAAWRLSPTIVRGYSLFFLAHAVVLDATTLGLTKVERLAGMYQALDYPNDRREALRVASELVGVLASISGSVAT